ncbi:GNAT family N-acetyltransferase, partial [Vibrio cholerae]
SGMRCQPLRRALCAWREVYSAVVSRIQRAGVFKRNVSRKNR